MNKRVGLLFSLPLFFAASSTAIAAATSQEADRLTKLFQSYLGAEPGVVEVKTDGDNYTATIDFAPLAKKAADAGTNFSISPVELSLNDKGGGKWDVSQDSAVELSMTAGRSITYRMWLSQDSAVELSMPVGVSLSANIKIESYKWNGVFDEKLGTFESADGEMTNLTLAESTNDPKQGNTDVNLIVKSAHVVQTGSANSNGGVDLTAIYQMDGISETLATKGNPSASIPPLNLFLTADNATYNSTAKGIKPKSIMDIVAFFVSHQGKDLIVKDQANLKAMLTGGLPLFENVSGKSTLSKVSIATPIGPVGFDSMSLEVEANGIVKDGKVRESISFSGISAPPAAVPPWAVTLVPKNISFDIQGSGFDLATPAQAVLAALDFSKDPPLPAGFEATLLPSLLPKGTADISLNPTSVSNDLYSVSATGTMTVGSAGLPSGKASIKAKGLDEVLKVVQAAPPEAGLQGGTAMIIGLKGMGKADADGSVIWNIESSGDGKVLVNGIDMSQIK